MPEPIPFPPPAARLERRRILNDTSIRSLKPPATGRVDYFDDMTPGLSLRVTANDVRPIASRIASTIAVSAATV